MGQSSNAFIVIISIVFSVVMVGAVALRFLARQIKKTRLGADDYLIVPGMMFAIGMGVTNIIAALHGNLGNHIEIGPDGMPVFDRKITVFLQCLFAVQLLSTGALTFTKLSILALYRRVFHVRIFGVVAWVISGIAIIWGISFFFATLFECYPIHQVWTTVEGEPRHCYDHAPMFYASAVTNMITDIAILTIPLPMIWKLQMPTQQKIAVSGIFLLGTLVCGISIARFVFLLQISQGQENPYDVTYNHAPTIYWTQLEGAFAVISACLPTFRPLFRRPSPESILSIFRTGKFSRLDRSKKSVGTSSVHQNPLGSKYDSSLSSLNKNANDTSLESGVEGMRMKSFDALRDAAGHGIMVQKKFGILCENV